MSQPDVTIANSQGIDLQVQDLGLMRYAEALQLQRALQQQVIAARAERSDGDAVQMHLLLVEHDPPVITVSRRKTARQHLIATKQQLETASVEVVETDRGGDITYHGPGQLVVYPILDLNVLGVRLHGYMRLLEQIVIDVLGAYGIEGVRDAGATGVWVDSAKHVRGTVGTIEDSSAAPGDATSKICALGVRVSRWVSMHGLALNVATNLSHFQLIVPCGLAGRPVTTMQALLGEAQPTMDAVKSTMIDQFRRSLNVQ